MRALVTGAGGFVGKHLLAHLLDSGDEVIATGREETVAEITASIPDGARTRTKVSALDINNQGQVHAAFECYKPDVVYHLAAITFLPAVEKDRKGAFDTNAGGSVAVFEGARDCNARILVVSSAQIYTPSAKPIDETGETSPSSFYGMTKLVMEQIAHYYSLQGVHSVIARPFNHSGPGQRPDFVLPSFARQIVDAERGLTEPKIRVGNLNAVRDFLDVRDVVRAYRSLVLGGKSGEIYNVCSGNGRSIWSALMGLVSRACRGVEVEVDPNRLRAGDAQAIVGNNAKIKAATGWSPWISFDGMLDALIAEARGR